MASFARVFAYRNEEDEVRLDHVDASSLAERNMAAKRRQGVRTDEDQSHRRFRCWKLLLDSGVVTPREMAKDYGVSLRLIYYGISQVDAAEREIRRIVADSLN